MKKLGKENQRKKEIQVRNVLDINHILHGQKAGKVEETHHYHIRDRVHGHHFAARIVAQNLLLIPGKIETMTKEMLDQKVLGEHIAFRSRNHLRLKGQDQIE